MRSAAAVIYEPNIVIHTLPGPDSVAVLPGGVDVVYGVHGAIAKHHGVDLAQTDPHPSTIDHVVAATGASLAATLSSMLTSRGILTDDGFFHTSVTARVVLDNGVLILETIDVHYVLEVLYRQRDSAIHAHELHAQHCPLARSLGAGVTISTSLELTSREPEPAPIA